MDTIDTTKRQRCRSVRALAVVAAVAVVAGCSSEDFAERIVENQIENQLEREGGGDVDIDLGSGEFRVETEDGVVEMVTDEDGNMRIQSEDGVIEMQTDEDGNVSIEGDGVDGEFSIDSEDGVTVFEGEDGSATFSQGADIPDDFPGSVPLPGGLVTEFSQTMAMDEGDTWSIYGTIDAAPGDIGPGYLEALDGAGFERQSVTETTDAYIFTFDDGAYTVTGMVGDNGDGSSYVNLTVSTSQS